MSCIGILYVDGDGLKNLTDKTIPSICHNCEYVRDNKSRQSSRPCGSRICQKALDEAAMEENL